jgi:hypothetical protein
LIVGDLEVIVGLLIGSIGIVHSRIQGHELRILVVFGKFTRAHEQHVFEEVSQSQGGLPVMQTSHTDRDRTSRLLSLLVIHQQDFETIGEVNGLVVALVVW